MLESGFSRAMPTGARISAAIRSKCVNGYEREYVELRMQDQVPGTRNSRQRLSAEPNLETDAADFAIIKSLWMTYSKRFPKHEPARGKDWLSESDHAE